MTSDAKIGLLLGLVFIFIIAFVINGLPQLNLKENNNELTTNKIVLENKPLGIGTKQRQVNRDIINASRPVIQQTPKTETEQTDSSQQIRYSAPMPRTTVVLQPEKKTVEIKTTVRQIKPSGPGLPATYIVQSGDNLASIAKKHYGAEEGNKRANISHIFNANSNILHSLDDIYVGQELIIPPLSSSAGGQKKITDVFSATNFKSVEAIGKRHIVKPAPKKKVKTRFYRVKDGDSLWEIASERLGNGNRYTEIAKLNNRIIQDENHLVVGMRLKIPSK